MVAKEVGIFTNSRRERFLGIARILLHLPGMATQLPEHTFSGLQAHGFVQLGQCLLGIFCVECFDCRHFGFIGGLIFFQLGNGSLVAVAISLPLG